MHIAILTFAGFNELDSIVALHILNRVKRSDWRVSLCCPDPEVTSLYGIQLRAQSSLEEVSSADAVIVGSGLRTREIVGNPAVLDRIALDPDRQLIGSQCSGAVILAKLGLLQGVPACTDMTTREWLREEGVEVLNRPFHATGNVATAGGCLASTYLAAWMIARTQGRAIAAAAISYVAPVGEQDEFVARAMNAIDPYLPLESTS